VAPLSPQLQAPVASGGGTARTTTNGNLALSPGGSTSPSETAPSAPGGGGNSVNDCMRFWDAATHMSKQEWRAACQRVQHRLDNIQVDKVGAR
jgi:hypothetical protein